MILTKQFKFLKYILVIVFIIVINSCQNSSKVGNNEPDKRLAEIFKSYWENIGAFDSFGSTSRGETKYNGVLNNDISQAFIQKEDSFRTTYYTELVKVNRGSLNENDRISYDILKQSFEMSDEAKKFKFELIPFHQFWGVPLSFMQLGSGESDQPFKTVKDYENFLGRINDFTIWADTSIANMRAGIKQGYVLPRSLVVKMIPQMNNHVISDPTKSLFYGPINKIPANFTAAEKAKFAAEYTAAIKSKIIPTFKKLGDFFQKEYLPKARLSSGIDAIPNGTEQYKYWVKYWTTTNMTPDEIHELGLKEVARIRGEMEKIKTEVGYKGDLKSFFKYVAEDSKFKIFKTPEDVLNGFRNINKTIEPQLKKLFNNVPKSKFEIRQTEKFREATASAEYMQGTVDGSRPGIFYTPILDAKNFVYPGMESLFLHEAIPGHHYQGSLQMENKSLPDFRKYYWNGAYGEGWALYCESLGKELGLYTNPYHYFGALGDEIHRAIRLVVDTGIHSKGWSREKAIQYSIDNEPTSLQTATAEVERYMAIPGQALSYKIGAIKIRALRSKYEKQLGAKFDVAKFHDKLLSFGNLPLDILENVMDEWADNE
jgi:uncharacterized protein (DUF885 family)